MIAVGSFWLFYLFDGWCMLRGGWGEQPTGRPSSVRAGGRKFVSTTKLSQLNRKLGVSVKLCLKTLASPQMKYIADSDTKTAIKVIPTNSGKLQTLVISHSYRQLRVLLKKFKLDAMSKDLCFPGPDYIITKINSRN